MIECLDCQCRKPNFTKEIDPSIDHHEESRPTHKNDLLVMHPVDERFRGALDYETFHIADMVSHYNYNVA